VGSIVAIFEGDSRVIEGPEIFNGKEENLSAGLDRDLRFLFA
jgi:hypothetical protein